MAKKQPSNEPEFRLRPRRPRVPRDESKAWSRSFKNLIHLVRMTSKPAYPSRSGAAPRKPHLQRCAVRVTYSPNRVSGQWAAHGRYISRGSATKEGSVKEAGFTATNDRIDIPQTLGQWQSAGDQRLFKLIISPEFGERLDLKRHTRELMARMEQDLDLRLEWVAVAHFNTDHPHVHIALRGRTDAGPLRLRPRLHQAGDPQQCREPVYRPTGIPDGVGCPRSRAPGGRRLADHVPRPENCEASIRSRWRWHFRAGVAPRLPNSQGQRARRLFLAARVRTLATWASLKKSNMAAGRLTLHFLRS